ncbi:hypothetical protein Tco_0285753 [Tanacetum coccineum]
MSPKNKAHYQYEKEAIHLLLSGIRDEIYSTVDACKTAHDMWIVMCCHCMVWRLLDTRTPELDTALLGYFLEHGYAVSSLMDMAYWSSE